MKHETTNIKTKKLLSSSLKELLGCKPLAKVTIGEITSKCNLNRKTFYYHFSDINQLLKWTLEQDAVEILKEYGRMNNFADAMDFSVEYIYKNKQFLYSIYTSLGRDELAGFFYNDFREIILMAIKMHEDELKLKINSSFRAFLSDFYAEALTDQMIKIFSDKTDNNKDTVSDYTLLTISISLSEVIKAAVHKYPQDNAHE